MEISATPNWPMVQALVFRWPVGRKVVNEEAPLAIARGKSS